MRISKLKILSQFRGLPAGYELIFNSEKSRNSNVISPICFVGLNGSGKSNMLEVIAEIFYYLETYHRAPKENLDVFKTDFGFEIEYELPRVYVMSARTAWDDLNSILIDSDINPTIKVTKQNKQHPKIFALVNDRLLELVNSDNNRNEGILPARIVGYSSGMNELLSNPFIKMDFDYFEDLIAKTRRDAIDINRMFFLNYDANKLVTVSNFLFDADDYDMSTFSKDQKAIDFGGINLKIIKNELHLKDLYSFKINFHLKRNLRQEVYLHSTLNIALVNLVNCATFVNESIRTTKTEEFRDIELVYWVNDATKEAFRYYFKTAYDLFRILYFFQLLNYDLISQNTRRSITSSHTREYENLSDALPKHEVSKQNFSISDIIFSKQDDKQLHYRKLSDGEHQLLQIFGSLLLMDTPGSVFLLDEPDTHFNPVWRSRFVDILNESISKNRDQEIILTTHSPYIVSDCQRENVFIFQKNSDGTVSKPKPPEINTFGTSINILSDTVLGKSETISALSKKKIEQIKNMPVDTLKNIQSAKEASRVLGDSVEKVMLFKFLLSKESELEK